MAVFVTMTALSLIRAIRDWLGKRSECPGLGATTAVGVGRRATAFSTRMFVSLAIVVVVATLSVVCVFAAVGVTARGAAFVFLVIMALCAPGNAAAVLLMCSYSV
ncbi:hypothetical protein QCE47_27285 [Caballeronia sp. LZ025]|uniref:hypothetical protein n=1 Tax=Caballeronia TaxID=1827195 RepID=UPI001FD614AE|nr:MULTISPECIES: hypothetical protein [Caballeronia]MDR5736022.1 hypothetical protein [Caballeronia sp. LZ025]MDR5883822.1 hypothetical protein [Caballeronia sp. LZ032]